MVLTEEFTKSYIFAKNVVYRAQYILVREIRHVGLLAKYNNR